MKRVGFNPDNLVNPVEECFVGVQILIKQKLLTVFPELLT